MKEKAEVEEMGKREKLEEQGRAVVTRRGTNAAKSEEDPPQGTTSVTSGNIMTFKFTIVLRLEATDIPTTKAATPPFTTLPASH